MKHSYLKYFLYLCLAGNFITGNSNETFLQPKARESSSRNKVISREPRAFMFEDMNRAGMCVEVDGVFYESMKYAGRTFKHDQQTIKRRCLSNKWVNYKFVPFRVAYTEKECNICGVTKLLREFNRKNEAKDGFQPLCRECQKEYKKEWDKDNPDYMKEWFAGRPGYKEEYNKEYYKQEGIRDEYNKRRRARRKVDIAFRLNELMSCAIRLSLKDGEKRGHWEDLVGYTTKELKTHLESLFTEGMNWENHGHGSDKWNIDHVIPISKWDVTSTDCQEFRDCWALKNLQPLWEIRNKEKGDRPMEPKYLIKPF